MPQKKPLLTTTAQLSKYVTLDTNETELPAPLVTELLRLEDQLLRALLGGPLLEWLRAEADADPALDEADSLAGELLRLVHAPLARIGLSGVLDELSVTVSNTGIQIMSTGTHKTAFQWQVVRLDRTLSRKGYLDVNVLVQWLEDNYQSSEQLQEWADSAQGQRHRNNLITSAPEFSDLVDIQDSWCTFRGLWPVIQRQSTFVLQNAIGYLYWAELHEQVRTRTLTPENEQLLREYVRPALAHLTLARAVPEGLLVLTSDGLVLAQEQEQPVRPDPHFAELLAMRARDAEQTASVYLLQLRQHLNAEASATRYATYFSSPAYVSPSIPRNPTNTAQSRVYRFI
ncbi:hypothetical protein MUN82_06490 [Hymenobacter aerilatus]|uniref:Uncharacterized protein n=1 Tax=Hymenobacter aerilatus TaxID=2932251 RepID=A0A8T9T188_9BACT|nr:DUF6712 family protein [Hymenobacter aerilatus]UOR06743.1 hypothetical protein MUN82_06490 [Hymenobacter aerilatus]